MQKHLFEVSMIETIYTKKPRTHTRLIVAEDGHEATTIARIAFDSEAAYTLSIKKLFSIPINKKKERTHSFTMHPMVV